MSSGKRIGATVVACVLTLGSGRVQAQAPEPSDASVVPEVFVAPLVVEGELGKTVQGELADRLVEGFAKPGLELVTNEATATHVVHTTIRVVDRDFEIHTELRERDAGTVVAEVTEHCELCGRTEAAETMTSVGLSLSRRVEIALRPPPVVSVQSGTTRAAVAQTLAEPAQQRRPVRAAVGWTAIALGNVGTVTGVTLLALHGRPIRSKCHGAAVDGDGTCRYVHSTLVPGAILGALGVGLLATGIALVVIERRRTPKPSTQARLGLGPHGPTLRF
jgi:hypothetical protein